MTLGLNLIMLVTTLAVTLLTCSLLVYYKKRINKRKAETTRMGNSQSDDVIPEQMDEGSATDGPAIESVHHTSLKSPAQKDTSDSAGETGNDEPPRLMAIDRSSDASGGGAKPKTGSSSKNIASAKDGETAKRNLLRSRSEVGSQHDAKITDVNKNVHKHESNDKSSKIPDSPQILQSGHHHRSFRKNKREAVYVDDVNSEAVESLPNHKIDKRRGVFSFSSFRSPSSSSSKSDRLSSSPSEDIIGMLRKELDCEQVARKKAEDWAATLATELESQIEKRSAVDAELLQCKNELKQLRTAHELIQKEVAELVYSHPAEKDNDLRVSYDKLQREYRELQSEIAELVYCDSGTSVPTENDLDKPVLSPGGKNHKTYEKQLVSFSRTTVHSSTTIFPTVTSKTGGIRHTSNTNTTANSSAVPSTSLHTKHDDVLEPNHSLSLEKHQSQNLPAPTTSTNIEVTHVTSTSYCTAGSSTEKLRQHDEESSVVVAASRSGSTHHPNSTTAASRERRSLDNGTSNFVAAAADTRSTNHVIFTPSYQGVTSASMESLVNGNAEFSVYTFDDVYNANLDLVNDDSDGDFDDMVIRAKCYLTSFNTNNCSRKHSGDEPERVHSHHTVHLDTSPRECAVPQKHQRVSRTIVQVRSSDSGRDASALKETHFSPKRGSPKHETDPKKLPGKVSQWEDFAKSFSKPKQTSSKRQSVEELRANVHERTKHLEDIFEHKSDYNEADRTRPQPVPLTSKSEFEIEAEVLSFDVDINRIASVRSTKSKFEHTSYE